MARLTGSRRCLRCDQPCRRGLGESPLRAHPIASYEQPIKLSDEDDGVERHVYIRAQQFQEDRMDAFALAAERDPAWQVVTLDAGHDLMISTPFELAQVLLGAI
jgi:hypothetical protein